MSKSTTPGPEPTPERRRGPLGGLTVAEWLTAAVGLGSIVVGIGSLAVSWLTYENAKDTRDVKRAIENLTALATQTKRQADATTDQLAILRDQVAEAKKQTKAISEQTTAIKANADASVRSADAQKRAADISASVAKATVALTSIQLSGFADIPVDGSVRITAKPTFSNVGGSTLSAGQTSFVVYYGTDLPRFPTYEGLRKFGGGNDLTVVSGGEFFPTEPFILVIAAETAEAVTSGRVNVFAYGIVDYVDAAHVPGRLCYAVKLTIKNGAATAFKSWGGPAYHCAT